MLSPHPLPRSPRRPAGLAVAAVLSAVLCAAAAAAPQEAAAHEGATPPAAEPTTAAVPGEKALLGRLVAPCCWNQTLDIHGGAAPDQMRAEIRRRLIAGETPETIEADFVARYGPGVRAVPPGSPIGKVALGVGGLAIAAGVVLFLRMRRWRKADTSTGAGKPTGSPDEVKRDAYDDRLDDELRALD